LRQSLNEIIRRHETLRTTIAIVDGEPIQVVAPDFKLALPLIDLQELPKTKREAESRRLAKEQAEGPFDLTQGPLMRALLLQLDQEEYVLLLTMHHIISDNWSIIVFFEELSTLYEAFIAGRPSPLPKLPIQYQDYAVWQRDGLQRDALDAQVAYWKGQLAGAPHVLELPTDWPRPSVVSFRAERQSLTLSKSLVNAVRAMSQRESVTTFMTLLAVFNVLLHRYTGQDDILVGSPIANRTRTETEYLIGLFLNNLVLRTRFSNDSDFRQLLAQVRDVALGAYANQDVPFEQLVAELQSQRDLSRTPLFQVFFNLFDSADNKVKLSGITAEVFSPVSAWSQFDLTLYAAEDDDTIQLTLSYNIDLFAPARIAAMLEQFGSLLEQIVAQPDKQISEYSLLTPTGFAVLPDPTEVLPAPAHMPITESFFLRAKESPDHPAICRGEESYNYSQLAEEARSIACSLLDSALKKGDVVAVSGAPSFGLIASMLGVLSGGGVLLTLDQNLPRERQKLMVREAGAKQLLYVGDWRTEDDWIRDLPSVAITLVREDRQTSSESAQIAVPASFCLPELNPSDAAYLFFTSGTSGVPKGVLGCHKGLSHFLKWQREEFGITAEDRAAQLTGLSFDVVLRDIFLPLTSGASLHLPDDPTNAASANILSWLDRERISILHTVPTLAQTWLNDVPQGVSLRSLRWVFFAGEPLTDSLVRGWREAFPASGQQVNLYGPTETTLAKCFHVVPDEPAYGVQPVGRPLPETQALVLGSANGLCGIGEPGEIVIRTPFRSLGYINAAEEQSVRFIQNPFTHDADDLLYRTGDRGRYQPDGTLEILGRLDEQIKIRGVRIELGEVMAVLNRHDSVNASVIVPVIIPVNDEQGEPALAAYIVAKGEEDTSTSELRLYLSKQLPAVMVPSYFVFIDELPLTPNGKVDRRRLPDFSGSEELQDSVAPRNETERLLAGIWREVLGVNQVSVFDNFFELGGHSLKATQVMSRVSSVFQIDAPVRTLFEAPTVSDLAKAVEERLIAELEEMSEHEAHRLSR
jgi:amino acid adenylation domain-containing protein